MNDDGIHAFGGLWGNRLPMTLQSEASECGLACLAMAAGYHGRAWELAQLRAQMSVSQRGLNLKDLIGMADRLGFSARPVRLELNELPLLKTPCILHWDLTHFVVLKRAGAGDVVIHDPAVGVRRLPLSVVSRHFTGVAVELSPCEGFEAAEPPPRVKLRTLLGRVVGLRGTLAQLFLIAGAIEVLAVLSPLFLQWVVDHVLLAADRSLLLVLALGFGLLMVLRTALTAMRGWMLIALGATLKVQGPSNLFSHLVNLPAAFFEQRHLGDIVSRFGSQETMLRALTVDMVEAVLDGILVLLTLSIMFVLAPMLTALVLAGALLYALLRWGAWLPLKNASQESIVWSARRESHLLETLRGVKTIKLFNSQETRRTHWLNLSVEAVNRDVTAQRLLLWFRFANMLLMGSLAIGVVWIGAHRVLDNAMTVGLLLAFLAYQDQFLARIGKLIDRISDLAMLRLHGERLADIVLTPPEPWGGQTTQEGSRMPASIEVRDLRFRYSDNEPWVLDGLNLRIDAGETVAIVGRSGGGKTTLLKLLASLLVPTEGQVLVDGEPLRPDSFSRWRSMIGVVMQDDQLFSGTVADNICFFSTIADAERIQACARAAGVHDELMSMPMGYSTLIGDMGMVLSGGQKQRILIARALYRNPAVLLLDEATSHLDVQNESAVSAAIRATQVTRIIIAHRPETIRSADRVIDLDDLRRQRHARFAPPLSQGPQAPQAVAG